AVRRGGGDHLVAAAHLGDHLQVRLQVEQGRERPTDEGLVVGEQQADPAHAARTCSRKPPSGERPVSSRYPADSARSRSPASPEPPVEGPAPRPSSQTSTQVAVNRTPHQCAPECRTTLVTPSRTTQANSSRASAG